MVTYQINCSLALNTWCVRSVDSIVVQRDDVQSCEFESND